MFYLFYYETKKLNNFGILSHVFSRGVKRYAFGGKKIYLQITYSFIGRDTFIDNFFFITIMNLKR